MSTEETNSYIFDPESPVELARLMNQDRMITKAMGGALAGVSDAAPWRNIVDLGCGAGGWVLDVAFELPEAEVEGLDISKTMVDFANARARTQQLVNASFGFMDMTQPFDLPENAYDLVNARLLFAVLKREAWLPFLRECLRVLRSGGLLCLTEPADFGCTNSPALNHFLHLTMLALWQRGYGFVEQPGLGMIPLLAALLRDEELHEVRLVAHALDYSAGTEGWIDQFHNIEIAMHEMKPLLLELNLLSPDEAEHLQQQILIQMQASGFCGVTHLTTVIGQKPAKTSYLEAKHAFHSDE